MTAELANHDVPCMREQALQGIQQMQCLTCCCCVLLDPPQDRKPLSKAIRSKHAIQRSLHVLLEFKIALACQAGDSQLLLLIRTPWQQK